MEGANAYIGRVEVSCWVKQDGMQLSLLKEEGVLPLGRFKLASHCNLHPA